MSEVTEETSDGFHTFGELYEHRMVLTAALCALRPDLSWRSRRHHEGGDPMFNGYFIVGLNLATGPITYHYKLEHWDEFAGVTELYSAPLWDGATPNDTLIRLREWIAYYSRSH